MNGNDIKMYKLVLERADALGIKLDEVGDCIDMARHDGLGLGRLATVELVYEYLNGYVAGYDACRAERLLEDEEVASTKPKDKPASTKQAAAETTPVQVKLLRLIQHELSVTDPDDRTKGVLQRAERWILDGCPDDYTNPYGVVSLTERAFRDGSKAKKLPNKASEKSDPYADAYAASAVYAVYAGEVNPGVVVMRVNDVYAMLDCLIATLRENAQHRSADTVVQWANRVQRSDVAASMCPPPTKPRRSAEDELRDIVERWTSGELDKARPAILKELQRWADEQKPRS